MKKVKQNSIEIVTIGNQVWMCKNLNVDHYRNGDPIPEVTDRFEWEDLTTGAWCYYDNDPENREIYGKLYNWHAVNDPRGLAPEGWHVPTDEEWKELEMCLGMSRSEADDILERSTDQGSQLTGRADLWGGCDLVNNAHFGTSGFSALPSGYRGSLGAFSCIDYWARWWSSSEIDATDAWYRCLYCDLSEVYRRFYYKDLGFSVLFVRN